MNSLKKFFSGRTFASLKIRNYKLFFIGQAVSQSGTWMQSIAQAWLILDLTHSGTALGLITATQFLPILLFGPWGGLITDRFPKKNLLYLTQTVSGLLALILGVLVFTHLIQVWMIFLLAIGLGFVAVIDNPTRQTFLLEMVGKDSFANAVSLNSSLFNLTRVIGPAIAGALIATIGIALCFIINGISYGAVIFMLSKMRDKELHKSALIPKAKGQLLEGFRYVKQNRLLLNTLIMMAVIGTFSFEFQVILPLFTQGTFHANAGTYAAMSSAMGLGSVFGGLYSARRRKTAPHMLIAAVFLFGLMILLTSIAPNLILAMAVLVIVGFFSINLTTMGNITLQVESTPEMRGRVMSLWTVAFLGSTPIGGPIIGFIGEHLGPRWGLATGGTAAILAALFGFFTLVEDRSVIIPAFTKALGIETAEEESRSK